VVVVDRRIKNGMQKALRNESRKAWLCFSGPRLSGRLLLANHGYPRIPAGRVSPYPTHPLYQDVSACHNLNFLAQYEHWILGTHCHQVCFGMAVEVAAPQCGQNTIGRFSLLNPTLIMNQPVWRWRR
jgi:hypothetical protein